MAGRTRSRLSGLSYSGGSEWVNASTGAFAAAGIAPTRFYQQSDLMFDTTSPKPWPDHDLNLHQRRVVNGTQIQGYLNHPFIAWRQVFKGYTPNTLLDVSFVPNAANEYAVPWTSLKNAALANLNPNKPLLDYPLFLFELREFPKMLWDLGRVLAKQSRPSEVFRGHLAYQFGWKPLFSDLIQMLNLGLLIDQRIRHLKNIQKGRVARSLGHSTSHSPISNVTLVTNTVSGQPHLEALSAVVEEQKYWYVAKSSLISQLPANPEVLRFQEAQRMPGVYTGSAATIWNMLPWTWLVDYFLNIGTFLDAHRSGIEYHISSINVMAKCQRIRKITPLPHPTLSAQEMAWSSEYKGRRVFVSPKPTIQFRPFWTSGMVGILGSLIASRSLR